MIVKMELEDGTVYRATANPKTFNGLATRSAFKKQFKVPPIVLSLLGQVFGEGDDGPELDLSAVPKEHHEYLDDEYLAFLVWMELKRRLDDPPAGPWERLVEQVVDVELDTSDDEAAEDDTGPS